ncbi:carboxylesterase family protein [Intrasporangium mesophilum]
MKSIRKGRVALLALPIVLTGLVGLGSYSATAVAAAAQAADAPVVVTETGAIRGVAVPGGVAFRGIPYAAPPIGQLRWKAPQPAARWTGVRDGSQYGPSSPQPRVPLTNVGGVLSEDSLYLNVSTPATNRSTRPVLVWFHGGGNVLGAGRDYDPAQLAAKGIVVVTVNYRLGALGFLAHPALASYPGGPSGNYGLMDQQAALRWVQRNIAGFGGNKDNVTIAGQSSGGLSVLAHLTSPGSRGLFAKAIVQSGSFALRQQSHEAAESFGEQLARQLGISGGTPAQIAEQLRSVPVDDLVNNFPIATIPGYVDGQVLQRSIGDSLASGTFARVPVLQGTDHDEEAVFTTIGLAVSNGQFVEAQGITADNYQDKIAAVLGVSSDRAAQVVGEYPLSDYASPTQALSVLTGDASFVKGTLQVNSWLTGRVPTYTYEFNDAAAPVRYPPPLNPAVATHGSELTYLFDLPDAVFQTPLTSSQEALADSMRTAWSRFAATGNPSTRTLAWPRTGTGDATTVMSLQTPSPVLSATYPQRHHYAFWAAG